MHALAVEMLVERASPSQAVFMDGGADFETAARVLTFQHRSFLSLRPRSYSVLAPRSVPSSWLPRGPSNAVRARLRS